MKQLPALVRKELFASAQMPPPYWVYCGHWTCVGELSTLAPQVCTQWDLYRGLCA